MKHEDRRFTANWINCHNLVKMKKMSFKSKCTDKTRVLRNCSTALWRQTLRSYSVTHAELGSHKLNQNITICFFCLFVFRIINRHEVDLFVPEEIPTNLLSTSVLKHSHRYPSPHVQLRITNTSTRTSTSVMNYPPKAITSSSDNHIKH